MECQELEKKHRFLHGLFSEDALGDEVRRHGYDMYKVLFFKKEGG